MVKYKTFGSGSLKYKVPYRKSPGGRYYIGKAIFQTKELAEARAKTLRSQGETAWVEGRTVYNA